ncbi:MAG: FMN-binding protein [Thermoanaerobaculia bacterium]|nr:FMN-binding protein [Thermoanaerobaculia bacterium]
MWGSATSSDSGGLRRIGGVVVATAALLVLGAPGLQARLFLTTEEALDLAFPGCEVRRSTVYLDREQLRAIEERSGSQPETAIVYPYRALCDGELGGTAYFDVHRVRTLPETLMIVVSPAGTVERVELLSFKEPPDYIPVDAWYEQFEGEKLDEDLALKREIRSVTGATLTARATTRAVRRTLALHEILADGDSSEGGKSGPEEPARTTEQDR